MKHTKLMCPCLQGSLIQARCFSCQQNTQKQHRLRQFNSSSCQCYSMQVCEYCMCVAQTHYCMNSREKERHRVRGSPFQWRTESKVCQPASWQGRALTGPSASLWSEVSVLDPTAQATCTNTYSVGLHQIVL